MTNYNKQIYKQLEEVINKLDKSLAENQKQTIIINNLKDEIKAYQQQHENDQLKIELLIQEIEKLKNKNNKNSSNSSKPSSTDVVKPKKTGPNIYNSRIKTGKKVGGQINHEGHSLSKNKIEEYLKKENIEVIKINHEINGNPNNNPIVKYKLGFKFMTVIEQHTFKFSNTSDEKLDKTFYSDVTYTDEFKSLVVFMNVHNVMSLNRITEFFKILSNGFINLSEGTIINFMREFSNKSTASIDNIIKDVLYNTKMFTDETVERINEKNAYVRNYSNEKSVVYKSHNHKGHNPIKEDDILPKYIGTIMGDHDTVLDSYGTKRIECNVHLGRYTVEITENVLDAPWAEKMKSLLERGNKTREYVKLYGLEKFEESDYEIYSKEFDKIIEEAKEETKNMKSKCYKDKSKKLYKRLEKNKEKHLAYLKDFSLAYSNNLSESDLRVYKIKLKVSGCFRSKTSSDYYADALSIIKTSKKRKENVLENIIKVFKNQVLFSI